MCPHHADQQGSAYGSRSPSSSQTIVPGTVVDGPLEAGALRLQVLAAIAVDVGLNYDRGYEGGVVHSLCLGKGDRKEVAQHTELQGGYKELGTDYRLIALIQLRAHVQTGLV